VLSIRRKTDGRHVAACKSGRAFIGAVENGRWRERNAQFYWVSRAL